MPRTDIKVTRTDDGNTRILVDRAGERAVSTVLTPDEVTELMRDLANQDAPPAE